jgi:hippurate hydrolase
VATTPTGSLLDEARTLLDDVIDLRRRVHRHPEIGLHLPRTQEAVLRALDGLGLEIRPGRGLSSVVAVLDGARPGPTILLRGDMDALPMPEDTGLPFASEVPGAMHACGHDAHVAMLVGAARLLAARRARLPGRVLFMFQPGEEGYHGARLMLEEGLLDGPGAPAAAFAIHTNPRYPAGVVATRPGPVSAASDTLQVTVRGRGGHASAPHLCLDPVPVACEIVQALQTLVTRRVDVFDPAVVTVARIDAGTTRNVTPETATLLGIVRTLSEATRERLREGVRRLAEGIAAAHGLAAEVTLTPGYPVTANDPAFAALVLETAAGMLGPARTLTLATPSMGSEDFSYVLQRVPGALVNLGTRPDGEGPIVPNHSNRMRLHEPALAAGVALHAAVALRFLEAGT